VNGEKQGEGKNSKSLLFWLQMSA